MKKKYEDDFLLDDKQLEKIKKKQENKKNKEKEKKEKITKVEIEDVYIEKKESKSKGGKALMYFLLLITFISTFFYFALTVIKSNEIIDQLSTIISTSILALFTVFFLIQSLFLDSKKGRAFAYISSLLLTTYSIFNIVLNFNILEVPTQEYMPNFTGKTLTEVVEWSNSNKITLNQIYETSDVSEEYSIISQDIEAGTLLKEINEVTVVVSEGPNYDKEIIVPNFIGKTVDDVIAFVDENYLTNVNIDFEFSDIEREQITNQDKSGQMKRNDAINFVASLGAEEDLAPVKMKDFYGLDTFHSLTWLKRFGFKYTLEYEYSDTLEKGLVLKQSIEKNVEADPLTTEVILTISKGPKIKVPDLLSMSVEEITNWVMENHLKIAFEEKYDESKAAGEVLSASVNKDDTIEQGALVTITISKGQLRMESFKTAAEFRAWAESYGIVYEEEYEFNDEYSSGSIIRASHNVGDVIKNSDVVTIYVSKGKSIEIPNFVGSSKSDISKKCSSIGLKCSFKYGGYSDSVKKDVATAQSKKKGSTVASGTSVVITLSSGAAQKFDVFIQGTWYSIGNPDGTIAKLKEVLSKECPGVNFVYKKKVVNGAVGMITKDSPVQPGQNTFVQGKTYTIYIGAAS